MDSLFINQLPQKMRLQLIAGITLLSCPQWFNLPWWINVGSGACLVWSISLTWKNPPSIPPRWLRIFLVMLFMGVIYASFHDLRSENTGRAFLLAMSSLKMLELRYRRDVYTAVFLGYFLAAIAFLSMQSLLFAVVVLAGVGWLTALLVELESEMKVSPGRGLLLCIRWLTYGLPLAALLFMFFPRLSGPLWGLSGENDGRAVTGFSETMEPGSITELARSNEIVLRAYFENRPPPLSRMYWRGVVLWDLEGRRWYRRDTAKIEHPFAQPGTPTGYDLRLEPRNSRWIPTLDVPEMLPPKTLMMGDYSVRAIGDPHHKRRFQMRSHTDYYLPSGSSHNQFMQWGLALPTTGNAHSRRLAQDWKAQSRKPEQIVSQALQWFRGQNFYYTLSPPSMEGDDSIDTFLFSSRKGFCEHYAGAFAFLMRAAGIPARIILGYQGGEYNEFGDYVVVRQYDAHAWVEIWLDNQGWTRIDPVAVVAPMRIEQGSSAIIAAQNEEMGWFVRQQRWSYSLSQIWDASQQFWYGWFLGYGDEKQAELMGHLGIKPGEWSKWLLWLLSLGAAVTALIALLLSREISRKPLDPSQAAYSRFCHIMARQGIKRRPSESPLSYAQRIRMIDPELAEPCSHICRLYNDTRYQPKVSACDGRSGENGSKELAAAVRKFARQNRIRLLRKKWKKTNGKARTTKERRT